MNRLRLALYRILETSTGKRRGISLVVNIVLIAIIVLNAIAIMLHTVPAYNRRYNHLFYDFEVFSVVFFTIEYLMRLWVCVENDQYRHWFRGRVRYMFSTAALIAFMAITPFYFSLFATDLAIIRILQLFRFFRLFRIPRYAKAIRLIQGVLADKKEELILCTILVVFMLIVISSVMYYVEHPAQPDKFSSIPATMWWGVNAMTTVGYGDIHPITPLGKLLGGISAILGIGLFALPTGIVVSGFNEHIRTQKGHVRHKCPHCGREI